MKPTVGDLWMLFVVVVGGVNFYLYHTGRREAAGAFLITVIVASSLGWVSWRWWKRRNSN